MSEPSHIADHVAAFGVDPVNGRTIAALIAGLYPAIEQVVKRVAAERPAVELVARQYRQTFVQVGLLLQNALNSGLHVAIRPHELSRFGPLVLFRAGIARTRTILSLLAQPLFSGVSGRSHGETSITGCRYGQGRGRCWRTASTRFDSTPYRCVIPRETSCLTRGSFALCSSAPTPRKDTAMKLPLVGAILFALSLLTAPVAAQECANDYDVTFNQFVSHPEVLAGNVLLAQVPADKLPELLASLAAAGVDVPADVTRAFIILGPSETIVGLESGGCLMPPIRMTAPLPTKGSGRLPDGRTMA